jgi:biopolymer transport protein ExbD
MPVSRARDQAIEPELNQVITPMLDLAFQVLLFFIMTYHPSQLEEGQMDLSLPDAAQTQAAKPEQVDPAMSMPGDLELPAEITVVVKTQHGATDQGGISEIVVQESQGPHPVANAEALRKYLQGARSALSNQRDIKIRADSKLKYAYVMEVMDMCTRAGFTNVSFGPPPDLARE